LAEQNMSLALAAAERCYVFAGGQIEREGSAGELSAEPAGAGGRQ
jgi:ABC-type branched-subunit amino acid transport system ATPase component